ncbi:MAG: hypothetical protein MZW92_20080 [Comamonadaceae bacterium]|nr:hypothetical protein [Comamonadaceae bacterium]
MDRPGHRRRRQADRLRPVLRPRHRPHRRARDLRRGAGWRSASTGSALFHEDLDRSAPFDPAATVPDASVPTDQPKPRPHPHGKRDEGRAAATADAMKKSGLRHEAMHLGRDYLDKVRRIPLFERILDRNKRDGSNLWAVSGDLTDSRAAARRQRPAPATRHPVHLLPDGPGDSRPARSVRQRLPGVAGHRAGLQPPHLLGHHQQRHRRHRHLPGAGGPRSRPRRAA